jgi:predicted dehydrogenase
VSGGGLFHDLAPHGLDLMLYFFGKPIEANGNSLNAAGLFDADDTTIGHLIFENKILFTGRWCFTVPEKRDRCEIIGTKGNISFSVFNHQPLVCIRDGKEMLFEFDKLQHVQQPMIQEVVNYFLSLTDNPCSGEDGLEVMQMIEAFTNK